MSESGFLKLRSVRIGITGAIIFIFIISEGLFRHFVLRNDRSKDGPEPKSGAMKIKINRRPEGDTGFAITSDPWEGLSTKTQYGFLISAGQVCDFPRDMGRKFTAPECPHCRSTYQPLKVGMACPACLVSTNGEAAPLLVAGIAEPVLDKDGLPL